MWDFYSPEPRRHRTDRSCDDEFSFVGRFDRFEQRLSERSGLTLDQCIAAVAERGVELKKTSVEGRTFHLVFDHVKHSFVVAVVPPDKSGFVTLLRDYGKLRAEDLRLAAIRALSAEDFRQWATTFDWAAQRLDRRDLGIRARYCLPDGLPDGAEREVTVAVSFPLEKVVLAGGDLAKVLESNGFLARANVDLYGSLGEMAPQAMSSLTALDLVYGPHRVLDMLAFGGPQLLSSLQSRSLARDSLTLFVAFVDRTGRPFQFQKKSPKVPAAYLFESMLPHVRTDHEFLSFVKREIGKRLDTPELLPAAVSSLTELQIGVDGRYHIDLIAPPDDVEAVNIMLDLP